MLVTVELPEDALARLRAEAVRRGVSIDVVIADFATQLPIEVPRLTSRLSFIGIGHSGRDDLSRRHCEIRGDQAAEPPARDVRRRCSARLRGGCGRAVAMPVRGVQ